MAIKKTDLYSSLWASCNELRGSMDASQYKDYVLVLLFMKYVTDKYYGDEYGNIVIHEGGSFHDMVKAKNQTDIGDKLNKIIAKFAEDNDMFGVLTKTDFADEDKLGKGKDMVDKLTKLIGIFEDKRLNFSKNDAGGDDLLGDAYEFLMRHFATESGKSKGQFYTPGEVSKIMAHIVGVGENTQKTQTVYDPTCGSGSLLLKVADMSPNGITINGQENDLATSGLAKMNTIIHGQTGAIIHKGNTLSDPFFKDKYGNLKTFDFVVANPPFSDKKWASGFDPANDYFNRFEDGTPPEKNGDYAFMLHIIKSLKETGKGAVILPHGVLFRGNAEGEIRKKLIKRGYIKAIIGLPANLFYGTGIPACIIVVDKEEAQSRKGIFMIDASKGFMKDGNKNRLRSQDMHKIVDVFNNGLELDKYSRFIANEEIQKNDYNLNIPRYIDTSEDEDMQNIESHLKGGIPQSDIDKLSEFFAVFKNLEKDLLQESRPGFYEIKIQEENLAETINSNSDYINYKNSTRQIFDTWKNTSKQILTSLEIGSKPKQIIHTLSEKLLSSFDNVALISKYDMYQHLMDYYAETMQDDLYMISIDGWVAKPYRVIEEVENKKTKKVKQVDKGWTCDLIPKDLIVKYFFKDENNLLENLNQELEEIKRLQEEMVEENSGDDGLIEEAKAENGNVSKASITSRIKEIKGNSSYKEELELLNKYMDLLGQEADLKKQVKEADETLDKLAFNKYAELGEDQIKDIVINTKWLQTIEDSLYGEIDKISQTLTGRISNLIERYSQTLPELNNKVQTYEDKVVKHLEKMGFSI